MTVTVSTLKARFPEFESVDSATVEVYLAEASRSHNVTQWGAKSDDGLSYLTAHLMAMFLPGYEYGNAAGPVSSEREGQVQVSYAISDQLKNASGDYGATKYGRRYLSLLNTIFVTRCT